LALKNLLLARPLVLGAARVAIYRADDAQVGRWSQPVSVTVGG